VDARDRLRRYLEQRRELGESEFVLDGLSVDDVLKVVGARPSAPRAARRESAGGSMSEAPSAAPPTAASPARQDDAPGADDTTTPMSSPVAPPPSPEVRFDRGASTDWRETLRNAGAVRPARDGALSPESGAPNAPWPAWLTALELPPGLDAARPRTGDVAPELAALPTLEALAAHIAACQRCALHATAKHPVPGEGHPQADVMCVGEAPGANEDEQGRPFVGEAGQLLTKILGAIQLSRDDVFICNVLKHRPPGNRDPLPDEVLACHPYLLRQIELVRPKVILALGRFAAQTLLQTTTAIGALRGKIHRYHGVPLIVTYHPAALLRNEAWKRPTWEDVKLARRVLDASRAASGATGGETA
jgi:DNA polymerase